MTTVLDLLHSLDIHLCSTGQEPGCLDGEGNVLFDVGGSGAATLSMVVEPIPDRMDQWAATLACFERCHASWVARLQHRATEPMPARDVFAQPSGWQAA